MTRQSLTPKEQAHTTLRTLLPPGTTVYTVLRRVSRSGMSRSIDVFVIKNNEPRFITYWAAVLMERRLDKRGSVLSHGCGMDMGFALVYDLASHLYRDGFDCIGPDCPANDHANLVETTHHLDGGYALRQRWL